MIWYTLLPFHPAHAHSEATQKHLGVALYSSEFTHLLQRLTLLHYWVICFLSQAMLWLQYNYIVIQASGPYSMFGKDDQALLLLCAVQQHFVALSIVLCGELSHPPILPGSVPDNSQLCPVSAFNSQPERETEREIW